MNEREYDVAGALRGLRRAVRETVPTPPAAALRERAEYRSRVRHVGTALAAAAVVAAVVIGATTVARTNATPFPPGATTPVPSGPPGPRPDRPVPPWPDAPDDPITQVDWANETITVPPRAACPSGQVRLRGGESAGFPKLELLLGLPRPPVYGDLTGDGRPEAVIEAVCGGTEEEDHTSSQLIVFSRAAGGEQTTLGWVGPVGWGILYGFWIQNDQLFVEPEPMPYGTVPVGTVQAYVWTGGGPRQVAGRPGVMSAQGDGPPIDLGPADGYVARSLGCPGGVVAIRVSDSGSTVTAGDAIYQFDQPQTSPHVLDLAGDGHWYVLVRVVCVDAGSGGVGVRGQGVLVLDRTSVGGWRAVDLVPVPLDRELTGWTFHRGRLTLQRFFRVDGTAAFDETWAWNGMYFQTSG
jgi:hypothetical protein